MTRFLVRLALFCLVLGVVCEVWFRTVVPASMAPFQTQDPEFMVLHMIPEPARSGRFTVGRLATVRTRWHINNAGWNSSVDYAPAAERERPCVAVIGNSYVEGFYADVDSGLTAALARDLDGRADVYNLGKSGVVMSQAVRVARYAEARFAPEVLVFVMNHGSLASSLRNLGYRIYNAQYLWEDGVLRELAPSRYRPNRWLRPLHRSAFLRYLYLNAGAVRGFGAIRQEAVQQDDPLAEQRYEDERPLYEATARKLLATVQAEHPDAVLLFVHDADRRRMVETGTRPAPLRQSTIWARACDEAGVGYIDLTGAFWDDYDAHRAPLHYPDNYHWNRRGMAIVAHEIAAWLQAHGRF